MKKIVALILAIFTAFSFVGCNRGIDKTDTKTDVLQLAIVNRGYGVDFLYKLVEKFEEKTGAEVAIVSESSITTTTRQSLLNPNTNGIDLYFAIEDFVDDLVYQGRSVVSGYECVFEDLSSLYDEPLEGWGQEITLRDMLDPFYFYANTYLATEKQYTTTWATALDGLIYNHELFEKYTLIIPRTTDELFEVMDQIKALQLRNSNNEIIYPFTYPGTDGYTYYLINVWFAQYAGTEVFYNFLQGKDADGNYVPECFLNKGMSDAYKVLEQILFIGGKDTPSNGYVSDTDISNNFTAAQVLFLNESAFMMPNGDWLDREANSNVSAGTVDIRFMKTPILSTITDNLDTVKNDTLLRQVIDYVDGTTTVKPANVSDADIEKVRAARSVVNAEVAHMCFIPAYSNNIELAKEFLLYFYSKEGQDIVSQYSYGNTAPLHFDYTSLSGYSEFTELQKSKFALMGDATYVARLYNAPIAYRGGFRTYTKRPEQYLGVSSDSKSYMSAEEYILFEYQTLQSDWLRKLSASGLD